MDEKITKITNQIKSILENALLSYKERGEDGALIVNKPAGIKISQLRTQIEKLIIGNISNQGIIKKDGSLFLLGDQVYIDITHHQTTEGSSIKNNLKIAVHK